MDTPPCTIPPPAITPWAALSYEPDAAEHCFIGPFRVIAGGPNSVGIGFWVVTMYGIRLASQHLAVGSLDESKAIGLLKLRLFAQQLTDATLSLS